MGNTLQLQSVFTRNLGTKIEAPFLHYKSKGITLAPNFMLPAMSWMWIGDILLCLSA